MIHQCYNKGVNNIFICKDINNDYGYEIDILKIPQNRKE